MRYKFLFFLFCGILIPAQKLVGDTLFISVSPMGDAANLLQQALNNRTGRVLKISVKKGTYNFSKNLATARPNTIIDCEPGVIFRFSSELSSGIAVTHDGFTIKNAEISGNGKSAKDFYSGYGILLNAASNCKILYCKFQNISGNAILLYPSGDKGCSNNVISSNAISKPTFNISKAGDESAIMLGYSGKGYMHNNNLIEKNTVDGGNILKIGIGFIGHGNNNIFKDNLVSNCLAYGIVNYESAVNGNAMVGNKILDNIISNIGEIYSNTTTKGMGIYLMTSKSGIVSGNKVSNVLRNSNQTETLAAGAISVSLSPDVVVDGNFIDGSFMYGIVSDYSFGSSFTNNTVQNIRKSGAYFINMSDALVEGNTFKNIGEVVLKGYFEHTSLPYIQAQLVTDRFKNRPTGNNFIIRNNTFYTDGDVLFFSGTKKNNGNITADNFIGNNTFYNNDIISSRKKFREVVHFRNEKKNSNFIKYNTF